MDTYSDVWNLIKINGSMDVAETAKVLYLFGFRDRHLEVWGNIPFPHYASNSPY